MPNLARVKLRMEELQARKTARVNNTYEYRRTEALELIADTLVEIADTLSEINLRIPAK